MGRDSLNAKPGVCLDGVPKQNKNTNTDSLKGNGILCMKMFTDARMLGGVLYIISIPPNTLETKIKITRVRSCSLMNASSAPPRKAFKDHLFS